MHKRSAYLDGEVTHEEYYGALADELHIVGTPFNPERLSWALANDEHLNSIPLQEWDAWAAGLMMYQGPKVRAAFRACGDFVTQAGLTCLLKAAARRSNG